MKIMERIFNDARHLFDVLSYVIAFYKKGA